MKFNKNWREYTLKEIATLKRGYDLPKSKRFNGNFPILASNGIVGYHNQFKVEGPGVTTGRSGTLGRVFYIKDNFWPLNTSLYVEEFHGNDEGFIYYYLQTLDFKNYNGGSSVPTLNRNHIHTIRVKIPSLLEQKRISAILFSLDGKIYLNNQINKNLEKIAQAIFKHWFVDFEFPNENGEPYKSSGGEMVESEIGQIPKRWRIIRLDKLIKRNKQKIKNMKDWEDKKLIDLSVMPRYSFCVNNFEKGSKLKTNIYKLNKFDILFGSIRPYFGKAGFSPINGVVAGTIFSYSPVRENLYSYILCLTTNKSFIDFTVKRSRGTKMPIIHWDDFVSYKIVIPKDDKLLESFNNMIMPLLKEIKENINMNQDLSDMRDILLPKLMSGEIRVPINSKNFSQLK